jgi:Tfp pilus assembly protein PilF
MEKLMRSLPRLLLVGFAGVALASPVMSQRADDQIQPKSVELQRQAKTLLSAGKLEDAEDMLETALAVDPRNRWAFVDLARVAEKQHLYGKAIRMTNKALVIEPNDPDAIAVQGEAMVEMGATARAQSNLQKLQQICGAKSCPQVAQLSAAISRGPTVASAKAPDVPKKN